MTKPGQRGSASRRPASRTSQPPKFAGPIAAVVILIAGCSGTLVPITPPPVAPTKEPTAAPQTPDVAAATPTASGGTPTALSESSPSAPPIPTTVELVIETAAGAEEFNYVPTTLEAPAAATIKLSLTNKTSPDDEIGHNWVLVQPGQEESVLANGIAAGDGNDWLDENDPGVIAATRLIEGGQRHTVTFVAPIPGSYSFMCTFPEHDAGGMRGTLTVR